MRKFFLFLLLFSLSCGFKFSQSKNIKKIAIPTFSNRTFKFGIEEIITEEVKKEFLNLGNLEIVSREEADFILIGDIIKYSEHNPISFDKHENVTTYRLILGINFTLIDAKTKKIISKWDNFCVDWDYEVKKSVSEIEISERNALINASREIGEKIALRIFDYF